MSTEINVPTVFKGLHFGPISGYEKLKGNWFEQKEFDEHNYLYRAFINYIIYEPDEIYIRNDGYSGNCWKAEIFDTENEKTEIYRFRNFIDLVEVFDKKGYRFVEEYVGKILYW
jgi:hypothetical protein